MIITMSELRKIKVINLTNIILWTSICYIMNFCLCSLYFLFDSKRVLKMLLSYTFSKIFNLVYSYKQGC